MAIIRWIVYSNVWVSLVAPSMLWSTSMLLDVILPPILYVFVFASTLFTYNVQRLYKAEDFLAPDTLYRHRWIWEHRRILQAITLMSGMVAFVCLFLVPFMFLLWLMPAVLVSIFYFIPFYGKKKRLRDIPLLKINLVAFVWSWATVACVCLMLEKPIMEWIGLLGFQFLFCFGLTVPFDIRDARFDKAEGIKTFVSQWGINNSKWFSTLCFVFALGCLFFFQMPAAVFFFICLYISLATVSLWFASPQRHELYYGFWLDGIFLMQGPVVFVATCLP